MAFERIEPAMITGREFGRGILSKKELSSSVSGGAGFNLNSSSVLATRSS